MNPVEDLSWYKKYIHSEKYDVSKWGAYCDRIETKKERSKEDAQRVAAEEESYVRSNMMRFHENGSAKCGANTEDSTCDRTLDYLFEYLQPKKLVASVDSKYTYKDETDLRKELKGCKVLIVTANDIERNILHYRITEDRKDQKITRIIHGNVAYFIFKWGEYKVVHVHQHQMGSNRDLGMRKTLEEVFYFFKPNVVFSMGVAFGIDPTTQNIGDVLVSHKVFPYSENKVRDDIIIPDRSQDKVIDNWLDVRFANTAGFIEGVTYGSILSGGSVLSSNEDKMRICRAYSKQDFVIGGEMEGSALFQLCAGYDIPCAVIKGICDWASCKNGIYSNDSDTVKKDENPTSEEDKKEAHLKTCAQAFAMTQVFEKCDVLFRDPTLFSHPKTRAVETERKISDWLACLNVLTCILMLVYEIFVPEFRILDLRNLAVDFKLFSLSFVSTSIAVIIHKYGRRRYLH